MRKYISGLKTRQAEIVGRGSMLKVLLVSLALAVADCCPVSISKLTRRLAVPRTRSVIERFC
jgi:hypothetical protein